MINVLDRFERLISVVLSLFMIVVVTLATLDVGWSIFQALAKPPYIFIDIEKLLDIFGLFLLAAVIVAVSAAYWIVKFQSRLSHRDSGDGR